MLKPIITRKNSPGNNLILRCLGKFYPFSVTIDYEKRGHIYSIALEAEHHNRAFNKLDLVIQMLDEMEKAECLVEYQKQDTSLFAQVLIHLGEDIDDNLIALNKILATPTRDLEMEIEAYIRDPENPSISTEDKLVMSDIYRKHKEYITWLIETSNHKHPKISLSLLGQLNVERKLKLLRMQKFEDHEYEVSIANTTINMPSAANIDGSLRKMRLQNAL